MGVLRVRSFPLQQRTMVFRATREPFRLPLVPAFIALFLLKGVTCQLQLGTSTLQKNMWTTVKFDEPMIDPVVFVSPPEVPTNSFALVLIGGVTASGFRARVYFPSCEYSPSGGTLYAVRWLAVEATSAGYYDSSNRQTIDWTAHAVTLASSGTIPAGYVWSQSFSAWEDRPGTPGVLIGVQNHREMISAMYSSSEYLNPLVINSNSGGTLTFSFLRQISHRIGFTLKVGIFQYDARRGAVINGVNLVAQRYDLKVNEVLPVADVVAGGTTPATFAVQWVTPTEAPLALVVKPKLLPDGSYSESLVAVEDCRKGATYEPHAFDVTHAFTGNPASTAHRINGGPNCFRPSASVPTWLTEPCKLACESLWTANSDDYWNCDDVNACFETDFRSAETLMALPQIDESIAEVLVTSCNFATRTADLIKQYEYAVNLKVDDIAIGTMWSTSSHCGGDKMEVEIVGAFYEKLGVSILTGSTCEVQDVSREVEALCKAEGGIGCSISGAQIYELIMNYPGVCFALEDAELQIFFNCTFASTSPFDCELYESKGFDQENGDCMCPNALAACTREEATFKSGWLQNLNKSYQYMLHGQIRYVAKSSVFQAFYEAPETSSAGDNTLCARMNTIVVCKNPTPVSAVVGNRGPNCYVIEHGSQYCHLPCLTAWDAFLAAKDLPQQSDYQAEFERFWLSFDFPAIPPHTSQSLLEQLQRCRFATRPATAPLQQYEDEIDVQLPDYGAVIIPLGCDKLHHREVVQALVGSASSIMLGVHEPGCRYEDATETVQRECKAAVSARKTTCEIDSSLFTSKDILCNTSTIKLIIRGTCIPGPYLPTDYTCALYPTTGVVSRDGRSCTCPNSAYPCTYEEGQLTASRWKNEVNTGATVSLANSVVWTAPPGTSEYTYTHTDAYDYVCSTDEHHFVLCKDLTPSALPLTEREPHCLNSFSVKPDASTVDDRDCQDQCASLFATRCRQSFYKWLCVAQGLPECYIPNTDSFTCQIDTNPSAYNYSYGSCGCSGAYPPCSRNEANATRLDWITAFRALSHKKGVVVARGKQALWTENPDRWRYENGMLQGGGCLNNSWFVGVFCGAHLSVTPPARGDVLPICSSAAKVENPDTPHPACRVLCAQVLNECKKVFSTTEGASAYASVFDCFKARGKGTTLDNCTYELGPENRATGVAELHTGWTVASASWSRVLFDVEFADPPVVFLGIPRDTQPFYTPSVRLVTKTSFEVKLYRNNCGLDDTRSSSAPVSWMAIPEGAYLTDFVENPVRVMKLPMTTRTPTVLTFSLPGLKEPEEMVALAQVQDLTPTSVSTDRVAVVISNLKTNSLELSLVVDESVNFSTVAVGILISGKQNPDLAAGLSPLLNRYHLQTFRIPAAAYSATSILGEGLYLSGGIMPHVFAAAIQTRSRTKELDESDRVVISRRATTTPSTWSALLWKKTCDAKDMFEAVENPSDLIIAGIYVEARKDEPSAILGNRHDLCLSFIGQSFESGVVATCMGACRSALPASVQLHCQDECALNIFAPSVHTKCMSDCESLLVAQYEECAGQCTATGTASCQRKCKQFLGNKCDSTASSDVAACLEFVTPPSVFEQCTLLVEYSVSEGGASDGLEIEEETTPSQTYENCIIVDMRDGRFTAFTGWDSRVASCKCPNDFRACTSETVNTQNHWRTELLASAGLCKEQPDGRFNAVTQQLWSTTGDLCALAADEQQPPISWTSNMLPAYVDQDVVLDNSTIRSGDYQCREIWHYVVCPAAATSTTTQEPPVPPFTATLKTAIVGEWGEWSACTGTCFSQWWTPKRTRTRLVLAELSHSQIPSVSETATCLDLPPCGTVCWEREWTEWSECKLFTIVMGQGLEYFRQQIKPIFDFVEEACGLDEHERYERCGEEQNNGETPATSTLQTDSLLETRSLTVSRGTAARALSRVSMDPALEPPSFASLHGTRSHVPASIDAKIIERRKGIMSRRRSVPPSGYLEETAEQVARGGESEQSEKASQNGSRRHRASRKQKRGLESIYSDASVRGSGESTLHGTGTNAYRDQIEWTSKSSSRSAILDSGARGAEAGTSLLQKARRARRGAGRFRKSRSQARNQTPDKSCSVVSEWSGCDSPCLPHKGSTPRRYRLAVPGQNEANYCTVPLSGKEHLCTDLPQCAHPNFDCAKVTASRLTDEDIAACKAVCVEVVKTCETMMSAVFSLYTSLEQCALVQFQEYEQFPGQCHIPEEYTSTRRPTKCFPSRTRRRVASGELPFIFQVSTASGTSPSATSDAASSVAESFVSTGTASAPSSRVMNALAFEASASQTSIDSCECYDPADEPCTAQEARDSLFDSLYLFLTHPLCAESPAAEGALFTMSEPNQTADAASYFALRGLGRMHCPVPMYKSSTEVKGVLTPKRVTFSEFKTKEDLNEFCHKGLSNWRQNVPPEIIGSASFPNCMLVTPREGAEPQDCALLCSETMSSCSAASLSFVELSQCVQDKLTESDFYSKCSAPEVLAPGEGIILCKKKVSTCDYTEWSEWSTCTATCFNWDEGVIPLRVRSRDFASSSAESRVLCRLESQNDAIQTEKCDWMPVCPEAESEEEDDATGGVEPRGEPIVPPWSPERPTDENNQAMGSEDIVPGTVECYVTNMGTIMTSYYRGYNQEYHGCNCPGGRRPCTRAEAVASLDLWAKDSGGLCDQDMATMISAAEGEAFFCATGSFGKIDTSLSESSCASSEYQYVLCEGHPYEGIANLTTWVICLLLGVGGGICFVLSCVQYSSDIQKLLGLAGSYPVLVQNVTELQERESHKLRRQGNISATSEHSDAHAPSLSDSGWDMDGNQSAGSAFPEEEPWQFEDHDEEPLLSTRKYSRNSGSAEIPEPSEIGQTSPTQQRVPRASLAAQRSTCQLSSRLGQANSPEQSLERRSLKLRDSHADVELQRTLRKEMKGNQVWDKTV
ncbi:microneme protein MIC15 [Toxoplasma gondii ME49]|uniref:Microneme protein MIC15 n=1 Tax=Toxoplasma gondii (strain ATCC 50611 / Me49) TaxID=508771 RepID=S8G9F5_TOXGM|nr:microneme protein MIC15 [Toxoplasma gondii ME49]EPT24909.1 microneme protein MIC15 [Toxoplasma gondii ME49]|eukprot:XP_018634948.1 microneme protein MIC15 [Toxoplasma gondii ME49]